MEQPNEYNPLCVGLAMFVFLFIVLLLHFFLRQLHFVVNKGIIKKLGCHTETA